MRILLFIDSLGAGGAQRQLVGLAAMLQRQGYDVCVCTYHTADFYKEYLDENNVPNEIIPGAHSSVGRIPAILRYFKRKQPDWVIAYLETPSLLACLSRLLGCRFNLIVSERNTTQRLTVRDRIRFNLFRMADAIVPNCHAQEDFLKTNYKWMLPRLRTITNFVDLIAYCFEPKEKQEPIQIIIVASIWPSKNTKGFIDGVRIAKERGLSFKVEWYGYDSSNQLYFDECLKMISEYHLINDIQLLNKTKQIAEKYRGCDFFCLPSFYEGTPNVICEAIASGRPVLCSDVCDNGRYVHDGENGFLFDPHDPAQIANAIEKAIRLDRDDYLSMCRNSRHIAEQKLSERNFLDKYISLINGSDKHN